MDGYGGVHYEIQGVSLQNACLWPAKETSGNKTSSYPYIPIPSVTIFGPWVVWSLGGAVVAQKLVSLVVRPFCRETQIHREMLNKCMTQIWCTLLMESGCNAGFVWFWVLMEVFIMKYKGFLYKMLVHDLLRRRLAIRPVPTHISPYPSIPCILLYSHLWSLGGVEPWECSGSPKLVSLVVLDLFVEKHKYTEKW